MISPSHRPLPTQNTTGFEPAILAIARPPGQATDTTHNERVIGLHRWTATGEKTVQIFLIFYGLVSINTCTVYLNRPRLKNCLLAHTRLPLSIVRQYMSYRIDMAPSNILTAIPRRAILSSMFKTYGWYSVVKQPNFNTSSCSFVISVQWVRNGRRISNPLKSLSVGTNSACKVVSRHTQHTDVGWTAAYEVTIAEPYGWIDGG